MSMNAISEAFARLGIRHTGALPRTREMVRAERENTAPDFRGMSDDDLAAAIATLQQDYIVITEELDLDLKEGEPRGPVWRRSAGRARAYRAAHLKLAKDEVERRRPSAAETKRLEKEAKAAEHKAREEMLREERLLRLAEAEAAWTKRQARRARFFLIAADCYMSPEDRAWLWDKARDMFPDAPELQPSRRHGA